MSKTGTRLVAVASAAAVAAAAGTVPGTLSDANVTATFDVDTTSNCFGTISSLASVISGVTGPSLVAPDCDVFPLWEISVVTNETTKSPLVVSAGSDLPASTTLVVSSPSANELVFIWNVSQPVTVDVAVTVTLDEGAYNFSPTFNVKVIRASCQHLLRVVCSPTM